MLIVTYACRLIVYASTVWFRSGSQWWQSNCSLPSFFSLLPCPWILTFASDRRRPHWKLQLLVHARCQQFVPNPSLPVVPFSFLLNQVLERTVAFVVLSMLATALLYYPAYYSPAKRKTVNKLNEHKKLSADERKKQPVRVRSAAQLVLRLLHVQDKEAHTGKIRLSKAGLDDVEETSNERTLKFVLSPTLFLLFLSTSSLTLHSCLGYRRHVQSGHSGSVRP
jgi:hypothetical protein